MTTPKIGYVVYDASALIAAERGSQRIWALHKRLIARGGEALVPAVVVTEVWRDDPRQHSLRWFLEGCSIIPVTEESSKAAGVLLRNYSHGAVDALVTEMALRYSCPCATGNRAHIEALAGDDKIIVIDI